MPQWEYRKGRWRYEFEYQGKRFGGAGFETKKAARTAEGVHRKKLEKPKPETETGMGFLDASNEYLENQNEKERRHGDLS